MTREREKKSKATEVARGKTSAASAKAKPVPAKGTTSKATKSDAPPRAAASKRTDTKASAPAKTSVAKGSKDAKSTKVAPTVAISKGAAKSGPKNETKSASKKDAKSAVKSAAKVAAPEDTRNQRVAAQRPGLRFGSRDKPLSPLSLTPPPPLPPTKSPSRGKGITIIEPKRQAMKAALEAEKATKSKTRGTPKLDLANARSVAAVAMTTKADAQGYVLVNGRRVRVISTKDTGFKKNKKKKLLAAPSQASSLAAEQLILDTKTKLPKADLDHYRDILLRHRRELVGRVAGLEDEALRSNGGNLSNMPLHPADIGTDTFDQDFALGMAATDRSLGYKTLGSRLAIRPPKMTAIIAAGKTKHRQFRWLIATTNPATSRKKQVKNA